MYVRMLIELLNVSKIGQFCKTINELVWSVREVFVPWNLFQYLIISLHILHHGFIKPLIFK